MSNLAPRTSVNKSTQPISTRRDWDTPCDNCGIPPKYLNTEYCSCPGSPKPSVGTLTAGFYIDLHESTAKLFESIGACAKAYHRTVDSLHQISRGQIKIFGPNGVVYIFYDAFIRAYPEASGIELRSTVRPDRPGLLEFVKVTLKSQKAKGRWRTAKKANLGIAASSRTLKPRYAGKRKRRSSTFSIDAESDYDSGDNLSDSSGYAPLRVPRKSRSNEGPSTSDSDSIPEVINQATRNTSARAGSSESRGKSAPYTSAQRTQATHETNLGNRNAHEGSSVTLISSCLPKRISDKLLGFGYSSLSDLEDAGMKLKQKGELLQLVEYLQKIGNETINAGLDPVEAFVAEKRLQDYLGE